MEYILYDVDNITSFVFGSFKPREVKAASEMLKCLDHDPKTLWEGKTFKALKAKFKDIEVIYSRGGGGLLMTHSGGGQKVCQWLEDHFAVDAGGGSLTAVSHPDTGDFQTDFAILSYKIRKRKQDKVLERPTESFVFTEERPKCRSCGIRPADHRREVKGEGGQEEVPYCQVCWDKLNFALKKKGPGYEADSMDDLIVIGKEGQHVPQEQIGQKYILVVYGDLNEAGAHLSKITSSQELRDFSHTLHDTFNSARNEIEENLTKSGFHFLMPVIGGDDMIVFTHPQALEIIMETVNEIEGTLNSALRARDMRMNFAFVVAKYNFPVYHLFKVAEELLKYTKEAYYTDTNKQTHHGFFWLWDGEYQPTENDVYPAKVFKRLFRLARKMNGDKNIKNSSLYQLLELISDDPTDIETHFNLQYFLAQHQEFNELVSWRDFKFWINDSEGTIPLKKTLLQDIMDLADCLPKDEAPEEVMG